MSSGGDSGRNSRNRGNPVGLSTVPSALFRLLTPKNPDLRTWQFSVAIMLGGPGALYQVLARLRDSRM